MKKKRNILHNKGRKLNWSVLAPDAIHEKVHKLDDLMNLLQEQYQFAEVVPVPIPERIPGKNKSNQSP